MNALHTPRVRATLDRLHREAARDLPNIARGFLRSLGRRLEPHDMADAYIAITREQGALLYTLLCATGARRMVEFGASFGISTLYLGAAARQNGGTVVTTEIEPAKCRVARHNIAEAGLDDVVTLLEGDAMETLADVPGPIDHLFLDGWNDLYLPLLQMLEPKLEVGDHAGTYLQLRLQHLKQREVGASIVTDNARFASAKPLMHYLRSNPKRYATVALKTDKGTTAFSTFLG